MALGGAMQQLGSGFNRTFMELKYVRYGRTMNTNESFNRTFMELKLRLGSDAVML